jgi:hypothetical protein
MWCGAMAPHSEMVDGYHPNHHPRRSQCCEKATSHEQRFASAMGGDATYVHAFMCEALAYSLNRKTLTFEGLRAWAIDVAVVAHKRATRGLRGGDPTDRVRGMNYACNKDGEPRPRYQAEALGMLQDLEEREAPTDEVLEGLRGGD